MESESINFFGPEARLHHIGLAVASIHAVQPDVPKCHDPIQKVNVAFVELHGAVLELIEPAGEDSPVSRGLKKGNKLVHLCYSVPDIEEAMALAQTQGLLLISGAVPAIAFENRRIAWLYHESYGLFELVEDAHA